MPSSSLICFIRTIGVLPIVSTTESWISVPSSRLSCWSADLMSLMCPTVPAASEVT